jgi:hypothetical protein
MKVTTNINKIPNGNILETGSGGDVGHDDDDDDGNEFPDVILLLLPVLPVLLVRMIPISDAAAPPFVLGFIVE